MKLTGDLKKKVEAAESRDEAKRTIADAGMLLTDDELEKVAGGAANAGGSGNGCLKALRCPYCGQFVSRDHEQLAAASILCIFSGVRIRGMVLKNYAIVL